MKYDASGTDASDQKWQDRQAANADELQRLRAELKNSHNSYALQSANLRAENDRSLEQADFWRAETVKLRAELAALQADASGWGPAIEAAAKVCEQRVQLRTGESGWDHPGSSNWTRIHEAKRCRDTIRALFRPDDTENPNG